MLEYNPDCRTTEHFSRNSDDTELAAMCERNEHPAATKIPVATGVQRVIFLVAAGVFFALGAAGVLLPGLPTTPFLLLTSFFLLRSSPALNQRLYNSQFLGPILRDWQEHRGVRHSVKIRAIALVVVLLAASIYLGNMPLPLAIAVLALGGVGLMVIALLPTVLTANDHAAIKVAAVTDPVDLTKAR
jgi:uncharacterized membrane protein YbaN (DUF454 family)